MAKRYTAPSLATYSKTKLKKQLNRLLDMLMDCKGYDEESYVERLEARINLLETELLKR